MKARRFICFDVIYVQMVRGLETRVANDGDRAVALFGNGFNCAEAVLTVLCKRMGKLGRDCKEAVPCVATGFGGGIGRSGGMCGALSGVVLALGLMGRHERAEDFEGKYRVYDSVGRLVEDFEREFGSSCCKDLIGIDLKSREARLRFRSDRVHDKVCSRFVKWCVDRGAQAMNQLREG